MHRILQKELQLKCLKKINAQELTAANNFGQLDCCQGSRSGATVHRNFSSMTMMMTCNAAFPQPIRRDYNKHLDIHRMG